MGDNEQIGSRVKVSDPEMLARFERNLRRAGMPRRTFLALASATAGSAALAACGGSTTPTVTPAPTVAPTKAASSAAAPTAAAAAAPTTAAASAPTVAPTARAASVTTGTTAPSTAATTTAPTAAAATGPESKKQLVGWITTEPVDNDTNRDTYNQGPSEHLSSLLKYDQDFNIQPDLAESYTNNGPVYTFKLRKGVTWSDGVPLTRERHRLFPEAADRPAYWQRLRLILGWHHQGRGGILSPPKPDAPNLSTLMDAVGVRAVDDSTYEVTGAEAYGLIPGQYAFLAAALAREDQVKKYADAKGVSSWTDPGKTGAPVVSAGPYMITAWKHNVSIDFVRNDKYWGASTIRQKYVTRKILPDLVKTTLSYENNDIDWQEIPPTEVDRFKSDAKLKSQVFPYINPNTRFLVPDAGHPPFDKLEVRKATLLSIDKDRLVNQVGRKVHTVAYAMTAPGVFGFFDDNDNKLKNLQKFDKTAAMDALKGTTYEGGRNWPKVTLTYNVSDPDIPAGFPDEIARQLKDSINMDVAIEPLDAKVWNARRFALDIQFLLYRWYQDYPDPHDQYYLVWSLHNKGSARQSWTDATFDDICKKAAAETDKAKRLDLYYQAETRIQTQFAYQPLYWQTINYAIKPWLTGFPKNKQGYLVPNNNIFSRAYDTVFVTDDSPHDPPK